MLIEQNRNRFDRNRFVSVSTNGTAFPYEIFLWDLYIMRKKNDVQLTFDDSYCFMSKIDVI